jgi:exodeoxyribonuclease V alpha subunit
VPTVAASALTFRGFERAPASELEAFLERWWETFAAPLLVGAAEPLDAERGQLVGAAEAAAAERFDRMERARLLSPTRARRQGVTALNDALHARAAAERGLEGGHTLAFGEPLLVTRNDYERNLFNGDQGLVLPVRTERGVRPSAVFRNRDGIKAYPLQAVRSLTELAWAVTVHKAQGSEYDAVALVLPAEPLPLTTRELVYTALTRARRGAVILGSEAVLDAAVAARAERFSGLEARFGDA